MSTRNLVVKNAPAKGVYLRQSNALTTAAYRLSRNEKRLVYLALEQIADGSIEEVRGRYDVVITHSDYSRIFEDNGKNVSRDISKASAALNKREIIFYIPDEDSDTERALDGLSWTTKRSFRPKRGTTVLSFNAELVDLIKADARYTGYFLHVVAKLNNEFAMRLYENIRLWVTLKRKNKKENNSVTFAIDWLINRYELPASYQRMSDFRRRFLIPAVTEIREKTDIELYYTENPKKGGRKNAISSITFTWIEKDASTNTPDLDDYAEVTSPPDFETYSDEAVVELGLVYIDNFSEECEKPNIDWIMNFLLTYQKVRGEAPPTPLKQALLEMTL